MNQLTISIKILTILMKSKNFSAKTERKLHFLIVLFHQVCEGN